MKVHFSAPYPVFGRVNARLNVSYQQRSPYYWWWQYLRRNSDYMACCERGGKGALASLYKDFGDVRSDNFRSWWGAPNNKGDYLFAEQPISISVQKIDAAESASVMGSDVMVVAVNLQLGRRHLQKKFADLLQREHKGKRGRKSLQTAQSTARYPLHRNFTQHSLKLMLMAYDAVTENQSLPKEQKLKLWQIGESLKLVPTAMPHKWDNHYDVRKKHATMTMTVSRYIKQARAIIQNTARGEFPNSEL